MDYGTISFLLGYSEPSSFFRAYKKWNKKTPKQSKQGKKEKESTTFSFFIKEGV